MVGKLPNKDYISILKYYKLKIPTSKILLQKQAETIMAQKLCKCIKKIDPQNEAKSIGICTKTIFNNKGYTRGIFQCKKTQSVKFRKTNICPPTKELNITTNRCVNKCKTGFSRNNKFQCRKKTQKLKKYNLAK